MTIGCIGVLLSTAAWRADRRLVELRRAGEEPLAQLQRRLADHLDMDSLRILDAVAKQPKFLGSATQLFLTSYAVIGVVFSAGAVFAFFY